MKKLKYALWALLLGFLGLLIYQNQGVFLAPYSLDINLGFAQYHIPGLYNVVIICVFFFAGLLIAYAASLFERFRARKKIRLLKQTIDAQSKTIATQNQDLGTPDPKPESVPEKQEVTSDTSTPSFNETAQS